MVRALPRILVPEILDGLPASDERAVASRRDLARINMLMFQAPIMAALLRRHVIQPPKRILEIGAGDGGAMLAVARRLASRWPGMELVLLDRADLVTPSRREDFAAIGWRATSVTADVFAWLADEARPQFDMVLANLFLHHFCAKELAALFALIQNAAPLLLATEPRRSAVPLAALRALWVIGANDVTRHDAVASVRAGFAGEELSVLWRQAGGTALEERGRGLFTHVFVGRAP